MPPINKKSCDYTEEDAADQQGQALFKQLFGVSGQCCRNGQAEQREIEDRDAENKYQVREPLDPIENQPPEIISCIVSAGVVDRSPTEIAEEKEKLVKFDHRSNDFLLC